MAAFAQRMLIDYKKTKDQIATVKDVQERSFVRIGAASLLNSMLVPKIVHIIDCGKIEFIINVQEDTSESLLRKIVNEEYDIGIMTLNALAIEELKKKENMHDVCFHVLAQDELVACVNAEGTFSKMKSFDSKQVLAYWKALCGIYPIAQYEKDAIDNSIICTNDVLLCRKLLLRKDIFIIMPKIIYTNFFKGKKFTAKPIDLPEKVVETHCLIYKRPISENLQAFIDLTENCMRQI